MSEAPPTGAVRSWLASHWLFLTLLALLAAAGLLAAVPAAPAELPSIALSSKLLYIVEKAALFFTAALLILVVLFNGWHGRLPIELRGVKWAEIKEAKEETQTAIDELNLQVAELRDSVDVLERLEGLD